MAGSGMQLMCFALAYDNNNDKNVDIYFIELSLWPWLRAS